MAREYHGMTATPLHSLWRTMRNRCSNPTNKDYQYYGGRGIRVCRRWDSFLKFATDVGPHPGKGWTLDRIDNDSDYKPRNIRWATRKTQRANTRPLKLDADMVHTIRETYMLGSVSQAELGRQFNVTRAAIHAVVRGKRWL